MAAFTYDLGNGERMHMNMQFPELVTNSQTGRELIRSLEHAQTLHACLKGLVNVTQGIHLIHPLQEFSEAQVLLNMIENPRNLT